MYSGYSLFSDSIINFGKNYLNTRYRSGGMSEWGFDCSGFTSFVYNNFGYKLPRSSTGQAEKFLGIDKKALQRGDLVFFNGRRRNGSRVGHVGIVTDVNTDGSFNFIHASVARGVIVSHSDENYYRQRYVGAGRVFQHEEKLFATKITSPQNIEEETVALTTNAGSQATENNNYEQIQTSEYHIVKAGESLYSIARKYQISQQDLKNFNGLTNSNLKAGQKLIISNQHAEIHEVAEISVDEPIIEQNTDQRLYTVQKGDTLYSISKLYGCTVAQLCEWNHKQSFELKIGEEILVNN
ncbi:hypothetical protein FACS189429_1120 [Bacteroidia bacterium]|nr:hypothetical protein FACS189429_1120 [Bacteroidia bacterium]